MKHPREYPEDAFAELGAIVERGQYKRFDDLATVPSALSRVSAFPGRDDYRTTVLMASLSSQNPPTIGDITPASSDPVYRVCTVRFDQHGSTGEPHLNKDDVLLFRDQKGKSWQLYAADQPGHYEKLSTDTQLGVALDAFQWPTEPIGPLTAMEAEGGLVDFSTGQGAA